MCCMLCTHVLGQETNRYFNFRPSSSPSTSILSKIGEIRVEASRQLYLGEPELYNKEYYNSCSFRQKANILFFDNWALIADSRIGLSYTLTDNLTLGTAFLHSNKLEVFFLDDYSTATITEIKLLDVQFKSRTSSWELFGAYHSPINRFFSYEARTGLSLGAGKHTYKRTYVIIDEQHPYDYNCFDDHLRYKTFRFNVGLAGAFHYRALYCVLQVNTGVIRHFGLSAHIYAPAVYNQMVSQISNNKSDFYADPSFMLGFDFSHWGFNLSCGYPWSVNDNKFIELKPTFGLGANIKINYQPNKKE